MIFQKINQSLESYRILQQGADITANRGRAVSKQPRGVSDAATTARGHISCPGRAPAPSPSLRHLLPFLPAPSPLLIPSPDPSPMLHSQLLGSIPTPIRHPPLHLQPNPHPLPHSQLLFGSIPNPPPNPSSLPRPQSPYSTPSPPQLPCPIPSSSAPPPPQFPFPFPSPAPWLHPRPHPPAPAPHRNSTPGTGKSGKDRTRSRTARSRSSLMALRALTAQPRPDGPQRAELPRHCAPRAPGAPCAAAPERGAPTPGALFRTLGTQPSVRGAPAPQGALPRLLAAVLWLHSLAVHGALLGKRGPVPRGTLTPPPPCPMPCADSMLRRTR